MSQQQDMSPQREILAYAVRELTKEWSQEEQSAFSKHCFDVVCTERYVRLKEAPKMNLTVTRQ